MENGELAGEHRCATRDSGIRRPRAETGLRAVAELIGPGHCLSPGSCLNTVSPDSASVTLPVK